MADVFAEIDDLMRQERLMKVWQRYRIVIVGLVIALILGTAFYSAYAAWDRHVRLGQTDMFLTSLDDPDFPASIDLETLEARSGIKAMLLLRAASAHYDSGRPEEAAALLSRLADMSDAPKDLRHLAIVMKARLEQSDPTYGPEIAETLLADLAPVREDNQSVWRGHARLDSALIAAHQSHDFSAARAYLQTALSDPGLSPALAEIINALDGYYQTMESKTVLGSKDKTTPSYGDSAGSTP